MSWIMKKDAIFTRLGPTLSQNQHLHFWVPIRRPRRLLNLVTLVTFWCKIYSKLTIDKCNYLVLRIFTYVQTFILDTISPPTLCDLSPDIPQTPHYKDSCLVGAKETGGLKESWLSKKYFLSKTSTSIFVRLT